MADPYARGKAPDLSGRPTGPPPWQAVVTGLGGAVLGPGPAVDLDAKFMVVHCRGLGTLAPLARLEPALAALLWLEHAAAPRSAEAGNAILSALRGADPPLLAIKQGCIGGPAERPGCLAIGVSLIEAVLGHVVAAVPTVGWERDPDFGYEVPSDVPGMEGDLARALMPRLLYADNDRVYEHADLVTRKKRERFELAQGLPGLDPAMIAATGWPPQATRWRECE